MKFGDLLKQYMGTRTLDEMAAACAEKGLRYDRTYISKLRTGDRPPPDDENAVRTLAEVCGRDPDPLILLARYERRPHEVLQEVVEAWVFADKCALHLDDTQRIPVSLLIARLQAGEEIPPAEMLEILTQEDPLVERLSEAYHHYRDRAWEIIDLITDMHKSSWGTPGERGTFEAVLGLPEGTVIGVRTLEKEENSRLGRLRDLTVRLSEVAKVPETALLTTITTTKAIEDPGFNVSEFISAYYGRE